MRKQSFDEFKLTESVWKIQKVVDFYPDFHI